MDQRKSTGLRSGGANVKGESIRTNRVQPVVKFLKGGRLRTKRQRKTGLAFYRRATRFRCLPEKNDLEKGALVEGSRVPTFKEKTAGRECPWGGRKGKKKNGSKNGIEDAGVTSSSVRPQEGRTPTIERGSHLA